MELAGRLEQTGMAFVGTRAADPGNIQEPVDFLPPFRTGRSSKSAIPTGPGGWCRPGVAYTFLRTRPFGFVLS